jgi:hypothetical protein
MGINDYQLEQGVNMATSIFYFGLVWYGLVWFGMGAPIPNQTKPNQTKNGDHF